MSEPEKKQQWLMAAIVAAALGSSLVMIFVPSLRVVGGAILLVSFLAVSNILYFSIYRDFFFKMFERQQRKDHDSLP